MSGMLRAYRRSIIHAELRRRGKKQVNKKVAFKDGDPHKSLFSRIFFDFNRKRKAV